MKKRIGNPVSSHYKGKGLSVLKRMEREYTDPKEAKRIFYATEKKLGIAKKRKKRKNPEETVEEISEGFHGRAPKEVIELVEEERYHKDMATIGFLVELEIVDIRSKARVIPIRFLTDDGPSSAKSPKDLVRVCVDRSRSNIELIGGDQYLDDTGLVKNFDIIDDELNKDFVYLGPAYSISYWTDKHHLEGPKYQENGAVWMHEFGEEGGKSPDIFYSRMNERLYFSGGSYVIKDE